MRAGKLNKRIRIERPGSGLDEFGQRIEGWELVAEVWAAVRPLGSTERLAASQLQSGQSHVITTRYSADLAAARGEWRIVFNDRPLNIIGLPRNADEGNASLMFDCTEGGADGH